jgi:NADH dehydrogenase (ubiquinone) 1 alpha subcomplex subunit 10
MYSRKITATPADARLVILEGNISAGKTSLAKDLAKVLGFQVFLEPTITNPFLSLFYADPKGYALKMQIWLLKQRYQTYVSALRQLVTGGGGIILDRSVWSDWVFAEKNRQDGNISEEGFQYYLQLRSRMLQNLPRPHDLIFLDVSPEVCYARVHTVRQRECESGIPLEYLRGLDSCYRQWVAGMRNEGTSVTPLNWNSFGTSDGVRSILARQAPPLEEWAGDLAALKTFLFSDERVAEAMTLPAPEALGLNDPKLQTQFEANAETEAEQRQEPTRRSNVR